METFNELDHFQFENVLRIAKEIKKPVLLHAEDPLYVRSATEKFKKIGDKPLYYYYSRPEIAEIISVQNACRINEKIGAELHFVHISSSESVDIISKYDNVTCETGPHYLEFSSEELERFGPILKTAPVVKSSENRERLREKFIKGEIFYIASDHAPAPSSEKIGKNIWEAYSGIPGIETLYIYTLSEFLFKKKIILKDFLKLTSENPAKRFNIFKRKGSIEIGKDCDLVVVNPDGETVVKGERFFSKGKLTPFEGMRFKGVIEMTILRGSIAFKNPDYFSKPSGIFIKPEVKNG
jgi:dihydroorotase-like cyclic amidohydrolase